MRRSLVIAPLPALALAAPAAAAGNPWLSARVLDIANQGGEDEFPSNTLYAFKRSVDGVMTARPVAFEKVLRSHRAPEVCG